ncbi:MAG: hypothetical protein SGCHY_001998 [Lobulomycetales sp.]
MPQGESVEGRAIPAIKITSASGGPAADKKSIFWLGGLHAREWASPATVMYITSKLLAAAATDATIQSWLARAVIHVAPVQNPDGYIYTRTNRLWRKNRAINRGGSHGVDLNRNWDDGKWGVYGASASPRSDAYRGPHAFSEPETRAVSAYILAHANRAAGIDFHAYSQLVLRNWGWTRTPSANEAVLKELGDGMAQAIYKTTRKSYDSIRGAELYPASGCSDDWMSAVAGIAGFTIELRDTGRYGFVLPREDIVPMGKEIWSAMQVFVPFVLDRHIPKNN